jgi:predicted negative regulator of RcsB-dependent stress response
LITELQAALQRGDSGVIGMIARLVDAAPKLGEQWFAMAETLLRIGQIGLGERALGRFREQVGDTAAARFRSAALLAEARRFDAAWALLEQVEGEAIPASELALLRGRVALSLGRLETGLRAGSTPQMAKRGSGSR